MELLRLILVLAAVTLFTIWLAVVGRKHAPAPAESLVLRYGLPLRLLGISIAFSIPILNVSLMILLPYPSPKSLLPLGVTLTTLGLIAGLLLVETHGCRVVVTRDGIAGDSPWRKRLDWQWRDIETVTYSPLNQWFVLTGPGGKVRASVYLAGIKELAKAIKLNVPGLRWQAAKARLDMLS